MPNHPQIYEYSQKSENISSFSSPVQNIFYILCILSYVGWKIIKSIFVFNKRMHFNSLSFFFYFFYFGVLVLNCNTNNLRIGGSLHHYSQPTSTSTSVFSIMFIIDFPFEYFLLLINNLNIHYLLSE
jgi:hypothetical protein